MRRLGVLFVAVMVLVLVGMVALHAVRAQTLPQARGISPEARMEALEQKVAMLESQNVELRSVIQISAATGSLTINPKGQLLLKGMSVALESATHAKMRGMSVELESSGNAQIKAAGNISLKGSLINLN